MDFLKLLDRDFGVNGGRFEFFVAEELLDEADVRTAFEQVRGAGVAEQMAASGTADPGFADELGGHAAEHVGVERATVAGEEQRVLPRIEAETRAHFGNVALGPGSSPFSNSLP